MQAPQAVIAGAVGDGHVTQAQCFGGDHRHRRLRLPLAGQRVENDVTAEHAGGRRLGTGGLDRCQAVGQHGVEDVDHLAVAIVHASKFLADPPKRAGKHPGLERRAVAQRPRLARQHRHVVPRVIDSSSTAEAALMLSNDLPVLADDDPLGVGVHLDRAPDRSGAHRVAVVIETYEAGL